VPLPFPEIDRVEKAERSVDKAAYEAGREKRPSKEFDAPSAFTPDSLQRGWTVAGILIFYCLAALINFLWL